MPDSWDDEVVGGEEDREGDGTEEEELVSDSVGVGGLQFEELGIDVTEQ